MSIPWKNSFKILTLSNRAEINQLTPAIAIARKRMIIKLSFLNQKTRKMGRGKKVNQAKSIYNSTQNSNSKHYILCHDFTKKYCLQCLVLIMPSKQSLCSKPAKVLVAEWVRTEICLLVKFWKNHVWKEDL